MTFVGKIFVVLIFVFSVAFAALTAVVFGTHRNWREHVVRKEATADQPVGLETQLRLKDEEKAKLTADRDQLNAQLEAERLARWQMKAKLEAEVNRLQTENAAAEKDKTDKDTKLAELIAQRKAADETLAGLNGENVKLREEIRKAQEARDATHAEIVKKQDSVHQLTLQLKQLEKRRGELTMLIAQQKRVLDGNGLTKDSPVPNVPPKIDGLVVAVRSGDLVQISLGSDDGLLAGHLVDVYRGDAYVGRLQISEVDPDQSVGRVIPEFQKSPFRERDFVRSVTDPVLTEKYLTSAKR